MRGRLLLVSLAVFAYACGKNPTEPSSQTQVFSGTLGPLDVTSHTLNITKTGVMTLTLSWPSGPTDLDLYLTDGACNTLSNCTLLASLEAASGTRETVTRNVKSGETYKAWIDSFGLNSVTYTLEFNIP